MTTWTGWLVQYTDPAGRPREVHCATVDHAYDVAAQYADGRVCGVRRRSELRQGQPAYETVPVDREGRAL